MSNGTPAVEVWQRILAEKPTALSGRVRYAVARHAMKLGGISFAQVGREAGVPAASVANFANKWHDGSGTLLDSLASWCGYDAR